jgi:hypothetical protein
MPPSSRSNRVHAWISGALLIAGSTLFLAGGRLHPKAATAFGIVGTPEFFRTFADHIQHTPNWIPIHVLILIGPVLWALGLPRADESGLGDGASSSIVRSGLESLASRAMLLGAALWVVVFVLDGFVAPQAATIIASAAPSDVGGVLASFRLNQVAVIRLGLVSWILIGVAMALHGGIVLATLSFRPKGGIAIVPIVGLGLLGTSGVAIGIWPIIATITGSFDPGPFTSPLWNVTALSTALWFAAFGVSSIGGERASPAHALVDAPGQQSRDLALQG